MNNIDRYFTIILNIVTRHWAIIEDELEFIAFSEKRGFMRGRLLFLDNSYLDFSEAIEISKERIHKFNYRYQYVKAGQSIFRYDNYPKHPGISPPYHHKHISDGKVISLSESPKFIDMIEEAVRTLF